MGLNVQQIREQVAYQNYRNQTITNPYTGQQGANASSSAYINGRMVPLNNLTDEEWEQLMMERELGKAEVSNVDEQTTDAEEQRLERVREENLQQAKEDAEFFEYMAFMENDTRRIENYM